MRRTLAILTALFTATAGALLFGGGTASADPSAAAWESLRQCESSGRYDINTGNGYYGAYQFNLATWRSVGGSGYPNQASPAEQDYRALYLYRMRGWQPWTCARLRGLTEDGDARSKVVPAYSGAVTTTPTSPSGGTGSGASGTPAYPGHQFAEGDYSEDLKTWQKQMGARGYGLTGTGYFGAKTKAVAIRLQQESGLEVDGVIGRQTWNAAWSSSAPAAPAPAPVTSAGCSVGAAVAPAWPGVTFNPGDTSPALQCWQKQMGARGYGLIGSGFYGAATKAVVLGVQARNGLNQSGILGPLTWKAAWEGR